MSSVGSENSEDLNSVNSDLGSDVSEVSDSEDDVDENGDVDQDTEEEEDERDEDEKEETEDDGDQLEDDGEESKDDGNQIENDGDESRVDDEEAEDDCEESEDASVESGGVPTSVVTTASPSLSATSSILERPVPAPSICVNDNYNERKRVFFPHVDNDRHTHFVIKCTDPRGNREHTLTRPRNDNPKDEDFENVSCVWLYADSLRKKQRKSEERAKLFEREALLFRAIESMVRDNQTTAAMLTTTTATTAALFSVPVSKPISEALCLEFNRDYQLSIQHDYKALDGRFFVPSGPKSATLLGGFPHAAIKHRKKSQGEGSSVWCGASHDVVLTLKMTRKEGSMLPPKGEAQTGNILKRLFEDELFERGNPTPYESNLIFYVELQFDGVTVDSQQAKIVMNDQSKDYPFKSSVPQKKMFVPQESPPYTGGRYEIKMEFGRAEVTFRLNQNITTANLISSRKGQKFRFRVTAMNPYLKTVEAFQCVSDAFNIKASLHNDLRAGEYYVQDGADPTKVTKCPRSMVKRSASMSRWV